jgi:hypothetical protein
VFVSFITEGRIPTDPTGRWACTTLTEGGQLVGVRKFRVIPKDAPPPALFGPGFGIGSGSAAPGSGSGSAGPGSGSGSAGGLYNEGAPR